MPKGSYASRMPREKTCLGCGDGFISRSNRGKFCTNKCGQMFRRHGESPKRDGRVCSTCCDPLSPESHLATKYCGEECRPARRPNGRAHTLPRKLRQRTIACGFCGKQFTTTATSRKFCSVWCCNTSSGHPGTYTKRLGRTCFRCGEAIPLTARMDKRFCTQSCQVCWNQEMRRARKRGLPVERISRAEIFERDNYTCHICLTPIEDKPVLDHLIPLAVKGSPGHVKENVAAAHAYCNSAKNARVRPADYRLYIELSLGGSLTA